MNYLRQITEEELRAMARQATSLFLNGEATPTAAVVKVASSGDAPLTDMHLRRVCEMTYHDIYERSFRAAAGSNQPINFDPPDAVKVAAAVRHTKVAAAGMAKAASAQGEGIMDKLAEVAETGPPPRNAFLEWVSQFPEDPTARHREHRDMLKTADAEMRSARELARRELEDARSMELHAHQNLVKAAAFAQRQEGLNGFDMLQACAEAAKLANVSEDVIMQITQDLARAFSRNQIDFTAKTAAAPLEVNLRHPLCGMAVKLAQAYEQRVSLEAALEDLRQARALLDREIGNASQR